MLMTKQTFQALGLICLSFFLSLAGSSRVLAQAALGDVNGDGVVDNFDLTLILGDQGAEGAPTDVNSDFITGAADYELAKSMFDSSFTSSFNSLGAPPANSDSAKLIYNAATGALLLDQTNAPGGRLTAFLLQSSAAFNTVSTVSYPFSTASPNLATRTSSVFAQADPVALTSPAGLPANPYSLGVLLNPGLDLAGLQALSLQGAYTGQIAGNFSAGGHLRSFQLVVVPEPASAVIALMGAAAAWRRGGSRSRFRPKPLSRDCRARRRTRRHS
jgi:hypothetical protein